MATTTTASTTTASNYAKCTEVSERVAWTLEEVLGPANFDFSRKFLPESLAQVSGINGLSDKEKLILNQIRGVTYAHLFGYVEEFIVQQIVGLAAICPHTMLVERRALLRFAEEEVKHQILFERVKTALLAKFECGLIPGAADVAGVVLEKSELCVLLLTSMLELMTQNHYTEMFRTSEERESLDPTFVQIFKSHWIEESQHTQLDELEVERAARGVPPRGREAAIDELLEIGGAFDNLLASQVALDLVSLERLIERALPDSAKTAIQAAQHKAYRYTFLVSALRNPRFVKLVESVTDNGAAKLAAAATALSA